MHHVDKLQTAAEKGVGIRSDLTPRRWCAICAAASCCCQCGRCSVRRRMT